MFITYNLNELPTVAEGIWNTYQHKKVWLFKAQMGSGKTTFINALCAFLQIEDIASSPTFSIINQYKSKAVGKVYHLDLYRLKDEEEAINVGVEDVLNSNNYCFVEWPEIATNLMPLDVLQIEINTVSPTTRTIHIKE